MIGENAWNDAREQELAQECRQQVDAAVDQYRRVKADPSLSVSQYINQPKLFGKPDLTEAQFELLEFIHEQGLRRKVPFRDLLRGYADWVAGLPDKAQMGFGGAMGPTRKTKPEVLRELAEQVQPEAEGLFAGLSEGARIATSGPARREELAGEAAQVVGRTEEAARGVAEEAPEAARAAREVVPGSPEDVARNVAEAAEDLVAEQPDEWVLKEQEVKTVFRRLGQLIDDGHMPSPKQMANAMAPELETELLTLRDKVLADWGRTTGQVENVEAVEDFLSAMRPRVNALRTLARRVGEEATNFAYHNYGDRRRIDNILGFTMMYPFWYTRTYSKWAQRLMDQPWLFGAYFDFQDYLHEVNEDLPEWWHDQIKVAHVLGEDYYIPLQGLINPLYGLVDHYRTEEQGRTKMFGLPVGKAVQELGAWGPSTHVLLGHMLALSAWAAGDKEAALAWMGYQSQWSKAAVNITAKIRDVVPQADVMIPPGGASLEPWHWEMTEDGPRYKGSVYDRKRIGYILADMVTQGEIDPAMADLTAYFAEGEVFDKALQRHALDRLMPNVVAWTLGAGLKPRHTYEAEINQMWDIMNELHEARDAGVLTGSDYSAAWRQFKRQYPYFNAIMMARMDQDNRDESLAWSVINRLPPGWRRTKTFTDEDVEELLQQFYGDSGDMSDWSEDQRRKFMAGVIKLAREVEYPTQRQQTEWEEARRRYEALQQQGVEQFGEEIVELEDEYWSLPLDERTEFANSHEKLKEYWDWWNKAKKQDPLVNKYYERPPEFWTQSDARGAFYDTYFSSVPPGTVEWALKDDLPLLNAMRDYDVRGWLQEQDWTVEQYRAAIAQVGQWLAEHQGEIIGNPQEWEQVRAINDFYWDRREVMFPRYSDLIDQYMELESRNAKEAFKDAHPELPSFWAWRDQFAQLHQLWAKYYLPDEYKGQETVTTPPAGGGAGVGVGDGGGGYARRPRLRSRTLRYSGGGGGGGRSGGSGVSIRNWNDFMLSANPAAVRDLFALLRGEEGDFTALQKLHADIGWGSLTEWVSYLLRLYRGQFEGTERPPSVQYAHWLPGTRS